MAAQFNTKVAHMSDIDRQRIAGVHKLRALGYTFDSAIRDWIAPTVSPSELAAAARQLQGCVARIGKLVMSSQSEVARVWGAATLCLCDECK